MNFRNFWNFFITVTICQFRNIGLKLYFITIYHDGYIDCLFSELFLPFFVTVTIVSVTFYGKITNVVIMYDNKYL
jgi:hypothetical protein